MLQAGSCRFRWMALFMAACWTPCPAPCNAFSESARPDRFTVLMDRAQIIADQNRNRRPPVTSRMGTSCLTNERPQSSDSCPHLQMHRVATSPEHQPRAPMPREQLRPRALTGHATSRHLPIDLSFPAGCMDGPLSPFALRHAGLSGCPEAAVRLEVQHSADGQRQVYEQVRIFREKMGSQTSETDAKTRSP